MTPSRVSAVWTVVMVVSVAVLLTGCSGKLDKADIQRIEFEDSICYIATDHHNGLLAQRVMSCVPRVVNVR